MSKNASANPLEVLSTPLAALVCSTKDVHYAIYTEETQLGDIDFQDDLLRIDNVFIPHRWFNTISACNEQNLKEFKEKLEIS